MFFDSTWRRLPWLIPSAVLVWGIILTAFVHLLNAEFELPPPPPIEVGLLISGLSGGGGGGGGTVASIPGAKAPAAGAPSPSSAPSAKATPALAEKTPITPPHAAPTPVPASTPVKRELAQPKPIPKPIHRVVSRPRSIKPASLPRPRPVSTVNTPPKKAPASATNVPNGAGSSALAAKTGPSTGFPANNAGGGGGGTTGSGRGGIIGSSTGGAQAIYAPLPTIPDDLRREVFHAEAIARFQVMPDGTAQVVLVKPTPNPRLNYLLLESLKQWRFFPAIKDGRAVSSVVEIRIPIAVE